MHGISCQAEYGGVQNSNETEYHIKSAPVNKGYELRMSLMAVVILPLGLRLARIDRQRLGLHDLESPLVRNPFLLLISVSRRGARISTKISTMFRAQQNAFDDAVGKNWELKL